MDTIEGTIFNIQHFCIHDGPGIRTGVFLKGCPLRCAWCSNPESQSPNPEVLFDSLKCTGCGSCVRSCKKSAVVLSEGKAKTDRNLCTGCGSCISACLSGARNLIGKKMSVGDVFREVEADRLFYGAGENGKAPGGVTLTGGEVLMQPEFAAALLKKCKDNGIHTAVETCGQASWNTMKAVMKHVDYVMYDIKHMSSERHRELTGVGNEQILRNLERLSTEFEMQIVVRMPVIPGINDSSENLEAMKSFLSEKVPHCTEVSLLPYHRLGEGKREQLESDVRFISSIPSDEVMESLSNFFKDL